MIGRLAIIMGGSHALKYSAISYTEFKIYSIDHPPVREAINNANFPSCKRNARFPHTAYFLPSIHKEIHAISAEEIFHEGSF